MSSCHLSDLSLTTVSSPTLLYAARSRQCVPLAPQGLWAAFIQAAEGLALRHPYVVKPSGGQVAQWGMCFAIGSVLGCVMVNPDGGSYPQVCSPSERAVCAAALTVGTCFQYPARLLYC